MRNFYRSKARKESNSLGVGIKSLCRSVHMSKLYLWRVQKGPGQQGWTCLTLVTLTSTPSRKHCGKLHHKRASLVTWCLLTLKGSVLVTFVRSHRTGHHHSLWRVMFLGNGLHHLGVGWRVQTSLLKLMSGAYGQIMRKKTKDCFSSLCLGTCISQNIGETNIKWHAEHNCSMHMHRDWGWTRLHHT